ncbi:MAG: hypothetical protein QOK31_510 [Solirubrobacteraceae bacterium]|jgi:hypothetical protein|nr:hypothetical protein [Solirubrobacteraceae bacterium]
MRRRLKVPSPSMMVALTALFVALVGTAYAASLPRNSVGPRQLKNNAVTSGKVKDSTLTGSDVRNGSLDGSDVKGSSLDGSSVKDNSLGGSDVNESSLGTVPRAASLDGVRYALVNADGTVDPAHSSGITNANVAHPKAGVYCLSGLSGGHVISATPENSGLHSSVSGFTGEFSEDFIATARLGAATPGFISPLNCPATATGQVEIADPQTTTSSGSDNTYTYRDIDHAFYVLIY